MGWSVGEYEHIAAQLLPAAEVVIDYGASRRDELSSTWAAERRPPRCSQSNEALV
jgi:hypothetical protein